MSGMPEKRVEDPLRQGSRQPGWEAIAAYAESETFTTYVESGSGNGDSLDVAVRYPFEALYSIEIHPHSYEHTTNRFVDDDRVTCLLGDSREVLPQILPQATSPALFYLDGHVDDTERWVPGMRICPIREELDAIFGWLGHGNAGVILIDDARLFLNGFYDYPDQQWVRDYVKDRTNDDFNVFVDDDVFHIVPRGTP